MSARLAALAERRKALIAGSDQARGEFAAIFGRIENSLWVADAVVAGARRLQRHRILVGVAVLVVPFAFRKWIRRAIWLLPLAIEGYRTVKAHREGVDRFL